MFIEQLQLFPSKKPFDPNIFENPNYTEFFQNVSASVFEAFELFKNDNKLFYDKTCKSNMLNNAVAYSIKNNCSNSGFKFIDSLSHTRRCFGILDDEFLIMFKKAPISNVKTKQDDKIKYQELDKHVLFLTYHVDDFWNEIKKVELRYYETPNDVRYIFDITNSTDTTITRIVAPMEEVPLISVKEKAKIKRKKAQ